MPYGLWFSPWFTFLDAEVYMATRSATEQLNETRAPREIEVPAPTAWPFILALGVALLFAGLVTSTSVSCLGALLSLAGSVGWFREVFPHEHEEVVPAACARRHSLNDCSASRGSASGSSGSIARVAPGPHLSDLGRCEREDWRAASQWRYWRAPTAC
jgi:hypothetical protein